MGKVEAGKFELEKEPFLLADILSDARLFAIPAKKRNLDFIEDIPDSLYAHYLSGDRLRLRQILGNFLSNAIKFTLAGTVTLRIRQEERRDCSQIWIEFEVEDTGVGIEESALPRLFVPFQYVTRDLVIAALPDEHRLPSVRLTHRQLGNTVAVV